ncbi:MAG: 50S ribosomal protein L33 [Deltaproteobacteria bacterium]
MQASFPRSSSNGRVKIALACDECGARNYQTTKLRKAGQQERLTLKKFCPKCNRRTEHKETK